MARTRALMTETDREYIARNGEVEENKRYQAISRVRDRLAELETDIEVLEEHHPKLNSELQEVVCSRTLDTNTVLRRLSRELGEPITVGDGTVFEDGDKHETDG